MTALGLFKDDKPLLASNMAEMVNRQFRTSDISPYSANVGFVLYACDELSHSVTNAERTFMLQLHVNEKIVHIPGCAALMCPYEQARKMYEDLIDRCNIKEVCDPDDDTSSTAKPFVNVILLLLSLFACRIWF